MQNTLNSEVESREVDSSRWPLQQPLCDIDTKRDSMGWTRRAALALLGTVGLGSSHSTAESDEGSGPAFGDSNYGSGGYGGSAPECFIATAAYDDRHETVVELRKFRDDVLLEAPGGHVFVRTYYRLSPPIAGWLTGGAYRRRFAQRCIVSPTAKIVRRLIHD